MSDRSRPRARRATDVVLLTACVVGLVGVTQLASPPSAFERALIDLGRAIPTFLDIVWLVGVGLLSLWVLLLLLASVVRWRLDIFRDLVVGLVVAVGLFGMVEEPVGEDGIGLWSSLLATGPPSAAVSARLALVAAAVVVASPHTTRPFRSTSRWLLGLGSVSLVVLESATPSGAVLGVLCGGAAASIVHLVFGSSGGRPSLEEIRRGLDELGVPVSSLSEATRQRAGSFLLDAVSVDGQSLAVRVYGRDAWDAQLLAKAWRALWYRDAEALTLTRLQQAEHEGFVTLLASRSGVPVHHVVRAGRTTGNDALIVLRTRGEPLWSGTVGEDVLDATWDAVLSLGAAGFAHGDLAPSRFWIDGGEVVLGGFAGVTIAPTEDQRRTDLAQLLVSTSLMAGADSAIAVATRRLGPAGLATVLPYLQRAALGPSVREALDAGALDLDDLRSSAATAAAVEAPTLAKLRRVSTASVVRAGLLAAAGYFFISTLAGVDLGELADAMGTASVGILFVALVWGQLPRLAQAESTRGACPRPIPYGPVAMLQFAITFVNLAIPSTAARVAVNIRFFQRQGIPPASAVSIGVVDSVGGFIVQLLVLLSVAVLGFGSVDLDLDRPSDLGQGGLLRLLAAVLGVVIVLALAAMAVPRSRRWVLDRIRPWIHEVLETLSALRSPRRIARVLGANLATEVLFATTLGIVLGAFGATLPLATLLVINVSVALFSGLMPVPGGIGVTEGALVVGLTAAGIDQTTAFGVAIAYRICTFYLPPLWGGVAFRRLERDGLL